MTLKRPGLNHLETLTKLKNDVNILKLIYDNEVESKKWNNNEIVEAVKVNKDIDINPNDELLMKKLRDMFNVSISEPTQLFL